MNRRSTPQNSVSASALSKMAFCEASVIRSARLSDLDRARIDKGNREHALFQKAVSDMGAKRPARGDDELCKVREALSTVTPPEEELEASSEQSSESKRQSRGRVLLALLITCALTVYLVNTI